MFDENKLQFEEKNNKKLKSLKVFEIVNHKL